MEYKILKFLKFNFLLLLSDASIIFHCFGKTHQAQFIQIFEYFSNK